ncbi:hypothetical protein U9M48_008952 [Paspalum notatum var. saurae]|uniref:DEAD/DEAH box helicase domain-containing protein n=1 Tax=Paspalum notatum var. saurae TaxID=547442 RepID=A0AAQ3SRR9_PASNO
MWRWSGGGGQGRGGAGACACGVLGVAALAAPRLRGYLLPHSSLSLSVAALVPISTSSSGSDLCRRGRTYSGSCAVPCGSTCDTLEPGYLAALLSSSGGKGKRMRPLQPRQVHPSTGGEGAAFHTLSDQGACFTVHRQGVLCQLCISGKRVCEDIRRLENRVCIVSATPSRVYDMIKRTLQTRAIKILVL